MPAEAPRLVAVGLSHRTAPVEVRERMALDEDAVRRHLSRLRTEGVGAEALIVSTCNRVELYVVPESGAEDRIRGYMTQFHGPRGEAVDKYLYWRTGRDAVAHLFRVASSLDSMVVGEPQILGQVKDAVRVAEEAGALGRFLGPLCRRTFSVAKRVRTETAIGRYRVGIGNAGVDLAMQIFGDLEGRRALLVGVGEMGRQVAKALVQEGLAELVVANRTIAKAEELADVHAARAVGLDRLDEEMLRADIVITASGGTHLVTVDMVKRALKARRYHPLFLVDLAVPRNVDPAVGQVEEAYLFNVDDLTRVLEEGHRAREEASREASKLVDEEVDQFLVSLREVEAGPAIGRLARRVDEIRQAELGRSKKLLDGLTPEQRDLVDAMTKAMASKILDGPIRAVRDAARQGDADRLDDILALWEPPKE